MTANDTLVIDIETAPWQHEEYVKIWPKSKKRPGLHAIVSQVICIGLCDNGQPSVIDSRQFDSEEKLLSWFGQVLKSRPNTTLVGFNSKTFDFPFLTLRAAKYGISLELPGKRSPRNIDIYEILGGKWQSDISSCSLSELAWFIYGEAKPSDGSQVSNWWHEGNLDAIATHCLADAVLTDRIYRQFWGVLW